MFACVVTYFCSAPCRHSYNCLLHLCGLLGRVNDAMDILAIMVSEGEKDADCRPDGYSYRFVCSQLFECLCGFMSESPLSLDFLNGFR